MKIAILGTRGIPAAYGGFETLAEELSARLAARGHDVTVYARPHGVGSVVSPIAGRASSTFRRSARSTSTPWSTALSGLHAAAEGFDAVLVCNGVNALALPPAPPSRGAGARRPERGRARAEPPQVESPRAARLRALGAALLRAARRRRDGRPRHPAPTTASGTERSPSSSRTAPTSRLPRLSRRSSASGFSAGGYVLYVSRFEPENNADAVVRAFRARAGRDEARPRRLGARTRTPFSRGSAPRQLSIRASSCPERSTARRTASSSQHAAVYVHATEVGGTHPALVEAMGFGRPLVVHDTPENREVAGDAALFVNARSAESLAAPSDGAALGSLGRGSARAGRRSSARRRDYRWEDGGGRLRDPPDGSLRRRSARPC